MASKPELLRRFKPGGEGLISDWAWRPMDDVRADIGDVTKVPDYITDNYGRFMKDQADRAAKGDIGPRDLLKAYGITTSSVGRTSRNVADDIAQGSMRPEGYFGEWLMSKEGQRYLNAGEKGKADTEAIEDAVRRFTPFGKANMLRQDLTWGAENLGPRAEAIGQSLTGPPEDWRKTVQGLPGTPCATR